MPKTKFENIVFTLIMSFLMVYAMICYNIALNMGGMSNQVFLLAFHELVIMWPVAFILEFFFVDKLAHHFAFKVVTPSDRPFFITLAISFYIICIMCPVIIKWRKLHSLLWSFRHFLYCIMRIKKI